MAISPRTHARRLPDSLGPDASDGELPWRGTDAPQTHSSIRGPCVDEMATSASSNWRLTRLHPGREDMGAFRQERKN